MLTFWLIALLCALAILRSKIMTALKEVSGGLILRLPSASPGRCLFLLAFVETMRFHGNQGMASARAQLLS